MKTVTEQRVHSVKITKDHPAYEELDRMCWASRALYNSMNYEMRQAFFDPDDKVPSELDLRKKYAAEQNMHWVKLPSKVAREVARQLGKDWKSYWKKRENGDMKTKPPKYHKGNARRFVEFSVDAITKAGDDKNMISLSTIKDLIAPVPCAKRNVRLVRIHPVRKKFKVEIVYRVQVPVIQDKPVEDQVWAGGDLGVDNFLTVSIDNADVRPLIISGKEVKSRNQWANKHSAQVRKDPSKRKGNTSRSINSYVRGVWDTRNRYMDAFIHNATSFVRDYLMSFGVTHFVVGWNKDWKSAKIDKQKNPGLGKKGNQKFRSLPYRKFLTVLEYKLKEAGIVMVETEESYTSKTSVIAGELPVKHDEYAAHRVKRGLLKVLNSGATLNADVNGACQITRKCKPEAFSWAEGVEGKVGLFSPVRVDLGGGCPKLSKESFFLR